MVVIEELNVMLYGDGCDGNSANKEGIMHKTTTTTSTRNETLTPTKITITVILILIHHPKASPKVASLIIVQHNRPL